MLFVYVDVHLKPIFALTLFKYYSMQGVPEVRVSEDGKIVFL